MLEAHLLKNIQALLSSLSVSVQVMDRDDEKETYAVLGLHASSLEDMMEGTVLESHGRWYLLTHQPRVCLYVPEETPGAKDILLLAGALVARTGSVDRSNETYYTVYRKMLSGELSGIDLVAAARDYQIHGDFERSVMVFHIPGDDSQSAYELLHDLVPMSRSDVLIDMDLHTVALVRDASEDESVMDSIQFAQAVQETLMSETALEMFAGIGDVFTLPEQMALSYRQARDAISVGHRFNPEQTIFAYSRLILERFLMRIPESSYKIYQDLIFNEKTQKIFNEEMLYTVEVFFKKDLNVSETAKSLYIHRNTLFYRLDKIESATGLDLRKFEDAVVFKIFMALRKERPEFKEKEVRPVSVADKDTEELLL